MDIYAVMRVNGRFLARQLVKKNNEYFWDIAHASDVLHLDSFYYFKSKNKECNFKDKHLRFRISRSQLNLLLKKYNNYCIY